MLELISQQWGHFLNGLIHNFTFIFVNFIFLKKGQENLTIIKNLTSENTPERSLESFTYCKFCYIFFHILFFTLKPPEISIENL